MFSTGDVIFLIAFVLAMFLMGAALEHRGMGNGHKLVSIGVAVLLIGGLIVLGFWNTNIWHAYTHIYGNGSRAVAVESPGDVSRGYVSHRATHRLHAKSIHSPEIAEEPATRKRHWSPL